MTSTCIGNKNTTHDILIILLHVSVLSLYPSLYILTDYNDLLTIKWPINTPLNQAFHFTQWFFYVGATKAWKKTHTKSLGFCHFVITLLTPSWKKRSVPTANKLFAILVQSTLRAQGYKNSSFLVNFTIYTLNSSLLCRPSWIYKYYSQRKLSYWQVCYTLCPPMKIENKDRLTPKP